MKISFFVFSALELISRINTKKEIFFLSFHSYNKLNVWHENRNFWAIVLVWKLCSSIILVALIFWGLCWPNHVHKFWKFLVNIIYTDSICDALWRKIKVCISKELKAADCCGGEKEWKMFIAWSRWR